MDKEKKLRYFDKTLTIATFIISVVTVSFVGWQAILQRDNYHKSFLPYVTVVPSSNSKKGEDGLYFFNSGTGTAILDKINIYYKGEQIHDVKKNDAFISLAKKLGLNSNCFMFGKPRKNDAINLNEMNIIMSTSSNIPQFCLLDVIKFNLILANDDKPFDIMIFYHSLYGDSYIYRLSDNSTAPD